jgi:hypothetical protein
MKRATRSKAHHFIERVVHRPQVRIDLLAHIAGQKTQALTGFHGRTHQDDAPHA